MPVVSLQRGVVLSGGCSQRYGRSWHPRKVRIVVWCTLIRSYKPRAGKCWAKPSALMDIIRDTGGMNSEMSGDVVNIFRRHEICYTPADP